MKTTILFDGPIKPKTPPGRFAPLAANAFRLLGLTGAATQREVFDAATSLRLAFKVGVEKQLATDLDWLAPVRRTEADIRDALGRLSAPAERARERLFWFQHPLHLPPTQNVAALVSTAESLLGETESGIVAKVAKQHESCALPNQQASSADGDEGGFATGGDAILRHDAALLLLAGLHRLDPTFIEAAAWRRAFQLWSEVHETEEFWSLLVAADLKGGFEPAATFGEVAALRAEAPRLVTTAAARFAGAAAANGRVADARRALDLLRAAALPAPLLAEYEGEVVGPFEDRCDEHLLEAFSLVEYFYDPANSRNSKRTFFSRALGHIERDLKPALRDLLEVGGPESPAVRRSFAESARRILRLAEGYRGLGRRERTANALRDLARAIAPPGTSEREEIAGAEAGTERETKGEAQERQGYEDEALRELRRELPQWMLEEDATGAADKAGTSAGVIGTFLFYGAVALSCFLCQWTGVIKSGPSRTQSTADLLRNYNFPVVSPTISVPSDLKLLQLAPRISATELRTLLKRRQAVVFDVRSRAEFQAGHIPGAIWLREDEIGKRYRSLSRDKRRLVFYCDCPDEQAAERAARKVWIGTGADVAVLVGGYQAWLAATAPPSSETITEPPPLETTIAPPRVVERSAPPQPSPTQ